MSDPQAHRVHPEAPRVHPEALVHPSPLGAMRHLGAMRVEERVLDLHAYGVRGPPQGTAEKSDRGGAQSNEQRNVIGMQNGPLEHPGAAPLAGAAKVAKQGTR